MSERVIPIHAANKALPIAAKPLDGPPVDKLGRMFRDLRISVTDRCNFRCTYCMPKDVFGPGFKFLPHEDMLTLEEIERIARLFVAQGVRKIRITGGEPLLRRNVEHLIGQLAKIPDIELTLTTNGSLLAKKAKALKDAGLQRITVSLDALDEATFRKMCDVDYSVNDVLEGIEAAAAAGLTPVKINMVVKRGVNDHAIMPMVRHFRGTGHVIRFIEFMDVGTANGWKLDEVMPSREIISLINEEFPLEPVNPRHFSEVAKRWRYKNGQGEVGVISSVTQAFCATCTRIRMSPEGGLYTCLFAQEGHNIRGLIRDGSSDEQIASVIAGIWEQRSDRYSEIRTAETVGLKKVEMYHIGG